MNLFADKNPPDGFRIAPGFVLPADADARRMAFVGMSGSGKTSDAKVIVEHLARAGRRVAIIDPAGIWHGLKTSADGAGAGLPFIVFGGRNADVPLEATAGAAVADLVMDDALPVILDLSGFEDDGALCRVAADFIRRLRFLQNPSREPLLLVVDEADLLAPQTARKDQLDSHRALINVARRSRSDGLGLLVITQRPAAITKDVLTQAEAVFLLRFAGYNDLEAVEDWIGSYLSKTERQSVIAALPSLSEGEAFVTSPAWIKTFVRVQFPLPETFDSSATPKAGERRVIAARADVDLSALAQRFAQAIQEEQENDPVALKAHVAVLERQLRDASARVEEKIVEKIITVEKIVPVPVLEAGQVEQLRAIADTLASGGKDMVGMAQEILARVGLAHGQTLTAKEQPQSPAVIMPEQSTSVPIIAAPKTDTKPEKLTGASLPGGAQRMLIALARCHHLRLTEAQLGTLTKLTPAGGTWNKYMGLLRAGGLVRLEGGRAQITGAGLAALGKDVPRAPQTTEEVIALWKPALTTKEEQMLRLLVSLHPKGLTVEGLAKRLGLTYGAGTFNKYLGTLKGNGLARVTREGVVAGEVLFLNLKGLPAK